MQSAIQQQTNNDTIIQIEPMSLGIIQRKPNINRCWKAVVMSGLIVATITIAGVGAIVEGVIDNEITNDDVSISNLLKNKAVKLLTWGAALYCFNIVTDKIALPMINKAYQTFKECLSGRRSLTEEEQLEVVIEGMNDKITTLIQNQFTLSNKIDDSEKRINDDQLKFLNKAKREFQKIVNSINANSNKQEIVSTLKKTFNLTISYIEENIKEAEIKNQNRLSPSIDQSTNERTNTEQSCSFFVV